MNTYVILTGGLGGVNGVVLYVRNKIKYMKNQGWKVILFHSSNCEDMLYVNDLKEWLTPEFCCPFLNNYPSYYNKKTLKKYTGHIIERIPKSTEDHQTIIETLNYPRACWGEIIASQIHAKHLIFLSTEKPYINNKKFFEFFKFKYERNELRGIQKSSLQRLFKGYMDIAEDEGQYLRAFCSNCIDNVESPFENTFNEKFDFHICTIGRMDKTYVMPMIEGIQNFCEKETKTVQLFFFGGAYSEEQRTRVERKLTGCKYLEAVITDFIWPVPISLLQKMDLAIAIAGAAQALQEIGLPTISMDANDGEPIGVLGKTTTSSIYRTTEEKIPLETWLRMILLEEKIPKNIVFPDFDRILNDQMKEHLEWIENQSASNDYFQTWKILNEGTWKTKYRYFFYRLFGIEQIGRLPNKQKKR